MNEPIPDEIGVIVLPGTVLFPHALLPLHIFESRYRLMLERALEDGRVFAVGTRRSGGTEDDVFPIGGAGVVRACVRNPDGTANLVLQGLRRVRFVSWSQTRPYRIARVVPLESHNPDPDVTARLLQAVRQICTDLAEGELELPPAFVAALGRIDDPDALSDAMISALIGDPERRRQLFEELDVPTRLLGLMKSLRARLGEEG